jgi:NTP pyrophosphatase (non-canonical NTP hydrolase)
MEMLGDEVNHNAVAKGFYNDYDDIRQCIIDAPLNGVTKERMLKAYETHWRLARLMLVVSEVAEAAEAVRKDNTENLSEELADVEIRIADFAKAAGLPVAQAIIDKMRVNSERPPMHGKLA